MEEWEYFTGILSANIEDSGVREFMKNRWPDWNNPPKFTPQTMIPQLNEFGKKGWELVHMKPVIVGRNYDVGFPGGEHGMNWTHIYFCVFKRRLNKKE